MIEENKNNKEESKEVKNEKEQHKHNGMSDKESEKYAQDMINNADKAMLVLVNKGKIHIQPIKNIQWRWEVKGILNEAVDLYDESTINDGFNVMAKMITAILRLLRKDDKRIIIPR